MSGRLRTLVQPGSHGRREDLWEKRPVGKRVEGEGRQGGVGDREEWEREEWEREEWEG